jgi:hypothetical protein
MLHPNSRLSLALLASLALWWPTLRGTLDGAVDPIEASLRWVAAFVVASVALRLLTSLVETYAESADNSSQPEPEEANVG